MWIRTKSAIGKAGSCADMHHRALDERTNSYLVDIVKLDMRLHAVVGIPTSKPVSIGAASCIAWATP